MPYQTGSEKLKETKKEASLREKRDEELRKIKEKWQARMDNMPRSRKRRSKKD